MRPYYWIDRGTCRFCGDHALAVVAGAGPEWGMLEGWKCDHVSRSGADWSVVRPASRLWEEAMDLLRERADRGDPMIAIDAASALGLLDDDGSPLGDVHAEMARQRQIWGIQRHPDGTGLIGDREVASEARCACEDAVRDGRPTWRLILEEEVAEAYAESDPARLREELVQVAAVAASWIEAIDTREP